MKTDYSQGMLSEDSGCPEAGRSSPMPKVLFWCSLLSRTFSSVWTALHPRARWKCYFTEFPSLHCSKLVWALRDILHEFWMVELEQNPYPFHTQRASAGAPGTLADRACYCLSAGFPHRHRAAATPGASPVPSECSSAFPVAGSQ